MKKFMFYGKPEFTYEAETEDEALEILAKEVLGEHATAEDYINYCIQSEINTDHSCVEV